TPAVRIDLHPPPAARGGPEGLPPLRPEEGRLHQGGSLPPRRADDDPLRRSGCCPSTRSEASTTSAAVPATRAFGPSPPGQTPGFRPPRNPAGHRCRFGLARASP